MEDLNQILEDKYEDAEKENTDGRAGRQAVEAEFDTCRGNEERRPC